MTVPSSSNILTLRIPTVVDEVTVRLIAAVVLVVGVVALATGQWWLYAFLAIDFLIRAITGPRHSPIARLVAKGIRPRFRVPARPTAFAPKRFAAAIGAAMTGALTVLWLVDLALPGGSGAGAGVGVAMVVIAAVMILFPALEALLGLCVGCKMFYLLGRLGLVDEELCIDCVRPASRGERVRVHA